MHAINIVPHPFKQREGGGTPVKDGTSTKFVGGRMGGGGGASRMGEGRMGGGGRMGGSGRMGGAKRNTPPKEAAVTPGSTSGSTAKSGEKKSNDEKSKVDDGKVKAEDSKPKAENDAKDGADDDVKIDDSGDVVKPKTTKANGNYDSKKECTKYESHSLNERQSVDASASSASASSSNGTVRRSRRMGAVVCPESDPTGANKELRKLGNILVSKSVCASYIRAQRITNGHLSRMYPQEVSIMETSI